MPGMSLSLSCSQRIEQRIMLRQAIYHGDFSVAPFRTGGEDEYVSQQEILQVLLKTIQEGEFIDKDHFSLEINRAIFETPLEARLGYFGKDIDNLIRFYKSNEKNAEKILKVLCPKDEEKKDIPGQIASAWVKVNNSGYFKNENDENTILSFLEGIEGEKDMSACIDIIAKATKLEKQNPLVQTSLEKLKQYCAQDSRIIPFAQNSLAPVLRALKKNNEKLTYDESRFIFQDIIESMYMLDRENQISGTIEKISELVETKGLRKLIKSPLPVPLYVSLDALELEKDTFASMLRLCSDADFQQGREIKREIYKGFSAIEELNRGNDILGHIAGNVKGSKPLAKVLNSVTLVSREPDFEYDFTLEGEKEILRHLRLQLVDKSIKRLSLDDDTLEKYLTRTEKDERFAMIGKIFTTLAGYSHYQNTEQISLMREIIKAKLDNRFNEWRYSHDKAESQMRVLKEDTLAWKENKSVYRLVGELDALESHIDAVKSTLPDFAESYEEYYKSEFYTELEDEIEEQINENVTKLRQKIPKRDKKELGYQTSLLREQLDYVRLLSKISQLTVENYEDTIELAQKISKKKSKNPLYENAKWIREVLDQPVYRDARRIKVYETDDLETLLRFGEKPIPHCQSWKKDSSYNKSLLSFVADANKKLMLIANGNDKPIAMSMLRLLNWNDTPTLFLENIYANEWSDDYGIALLGSLADKAADICQETKQTVNIAVPMHSGHDGHSTNVQVRTAMEKFGEKYKVEIQEEMLHTRPAESKNTSEYWDCDCGSSDDKKIIHVKYVAFSYDDDH